MIYKVGFTRHALRELEAAFDWIHERSPQAASRWHDRLMDSVRSLRENPERYALAPESEWFAGEIRQLLSGKKKNAYRILFEIRKDSVFILRVRHGAQALLEPGEI